MDYPLRCNYFICKIRNFTCFLQSHSVVKGLVRVLRENTNQFLRYSYVFSLRELGGPGRIKTNPVDLTGFEPVTSALQMLRSTS